MGQQDSVFMRTFMSILAVLVVLAFVFFGIAQMASSTDSKPVATSKSNDNIKRVAVSDTDKRVASKVVRGESPEKMGAVCFGCHNSGVGGAPKTGDKAAWSARAKKGVDKMVAVVVKGKGIMQPRGGTKLTDAQIKTVVEHMMKKAGL